MLQPEVPRVLQPELPPQLELQTQEPERAVLAALKELVEQPRVERDESKELAASSSRENVDV